MFFKRWPGSPADALGAWTKESPWPATETKVGKDRSWWPSSTLGFERLGINTARRKQGSTLPGPTLPPGHLKPPRYRMSAWSSCILDPLWILNLHRKDPNEICTPVFLHVNTHNPPPSSARVLLFPSPRSHLFIRSWSCQLAPGRQGATGYGGDD